MTDSELYCPKSPDALHCRHWWDGNTCGYCRSPPLANEDRAEQGMEPYDLRDDPHADD